jgi:hypothetical protein
LFVRDDEQILGLTRLLSLVLRLLTMIEMRVCHGLAQAHATLEGEAGV